MIYVCIPSYDEAATVGLVLWKIRRVLEDSTREYQLLVGDDASTDATRDVLQPYTRALPLDVLRTEERIGYAATVERLLREALKRSDRHKRDVAVLIPADATCDAADLPEMLKRLDSGADIVVGERTSQVEATRGERRVRRWARRLLGRRVRVAGVEDIVSGFVAFRLITLRTAFRDQATPWLAVEGWAANAQLIAWAAAGARRVETVPVTERLDRRQRPTRMTPWERAKSLWAARRRLPRPPVVDARPTAPAIPSKESA